MRLISVIRWLAVVPSAIVAWYLAFFIGVILLVLLVPCPSDSPRPEICDAPWFPLRLLERGIFFFGVGLSATLVVIVSAFVAPSHRSAVAWAALGVGAAVAVVMGYLAERVAEPATAIVFGLLAALFVSRFTSRSREGTVASVAPDA